MRPSESSARPATTRRGSRRGPDDVGWGSASGALPRWACLAPEREETGREREGLGGIEAEAEAIVVEKESERALPVFYPLSVRLSRPFSTIASTTTKIKDQLFRCRRSSDCAPHVATVYKQ